MVREAKSAEIPVDSMFEKVLASAENYAANPARKVVSEPPFRPIDFLIAMLATHRSAVMDLVNDEGLSSSAVRGLACVVAQRMGVDVESAIGSKPESNLYVDCSEVQIQGVIDAACVLKTSRRLNSGTPFGTKPKEK